MGFVKFEAETKPRHDVRLTGTTLIFDGDAANDLGDNVSLFFDADRQLVGIQRADSRDASTFVVKRGPRGARVNAKALFAKHGISEPSLEHGRLGTEGNLRVVTLATPAPAQQTYTGKRRGRRPKSAA